MKRRDLLLSILCFLVFAEASSWLTAGYNSPLCIVTWENAGETGSEDQKYCPTFISGTLLMSRQAFEWVKHNDNDKAVVAGFTVVLALSTIGLWLATGRLWEAGERQLNFLQASSQRGLRAYVFIDDGCKLVFDTTTNQASILIKLQNSGQTPAYEFTSWIDGDAFLYDAFPFPPTTKLISDRMSASIVGPQQGAQIHSEHNPFERCIFDAIQANQLALFVWGGWDYTDAFGNRWEFMFRMRISGLAQEVKGNEFIWALQPHPIGYSERQVSRMSIG